MLTTNSKSRLNPPRSKGNGAKYPPLSKLYPLPSTSSQISKAVYDLEADLSIPYHYAAARASFATRLKACPKEVTLSILASKHEEADGKNIEVQALLEKDVLTIFSFDSAGRLVIRVSGFLGGIRHSTKTLFVFPSQRDVEKCEELAISPGVGQSDSRIEIAGRTGNNRYVEYGTWRRGLPSGLL
jgi:hypothetical protein